MFFLRYQRQFFIVPAALVVLSLAAVLKFGLIPGIDLVGGSILEVSYSETRPNIDEVREIADGMDYGPVRVQPSGEKNVIFRQRELSPAEKDAFLEKLGSVQEVQFNSIGPSIGRELVSKAYWAIILVTLSIILFIAFAFRHVSKPVASWKYGAVAIVTLLHDIIVPIGLFAYLGYVRGAEVDALFIVALLTILGISINDTIVVFDRIRENLRINEEKKRHEPFAEIVAHSTMQTLTRSVNTSVTVIIVLIALFVYGPSTTKDFALTLIVGMVAGTYSSIFLASPLLVEIERYQRKNEKKA